MWAVVLWGKQGMGGGGGVCQWRTSMQQEQVSSAQLDSWHALLLCTQHSAPALLQGQLKAQQRQLHDSNTAM